MKRIPLWHLLMMLPLSLVIIVSGLPLCGRTTVSGAEPAVQDAAITATPEYPGARIRTQQTEQNNAVIAGATALSFSRNTLKDITISDNSEEITIEFIADQEIEQYHPVVLKNPARLAIDFPSTAKAISRSVIHIDDPLIDGIRMGETANQVRCVIDFATPEVPPYKIAQKNNALTVKIEHSRMHPAQEVHAQSVPLQPYGDESPQRASKLITETPNSADEKSPTAQKGASSPGNDAKKMTAQKNMPRAEQPLTIEESGRESLIKEKDSGTTYTGQKISLDFKDADIKNIFRLISDVSGFNIITSDKVSGKVTLKMEDIPWDQALDIILESNNLGKIVAGNIIRIDTLEQILKTQKDKMEKTAFQDLVMDTVSINYVKAKEIEKYIKDLKILTEKRGSINSFEHTNSVTITDVPEKVNRIKQLIREQDVPTPQVLIEARIVQSNPSYVKELGVIWGSFYNTSKDGGAAQGGADIAISGAAGRGAVVNLPAAIGAGSGGGINFGYVTNSLQLDVQLSALEKDEKIKIVSSPKVLSLDNKEARIKQGVALPYLKLSEQGVTSTEFKDAVLELKVTPRISPANTINLHVYVTKNQKSAQTGANDEPGIDVREVETDLIVENGKTIVIGGIYETTQTKIINKVPFFADIPLFGYFFKKTRNEDLLTELLVFLTVSTVNQPLITSKINSERQ